MPIGLCSCRSCVHNVLTNFDTIIHRTLHHTKPSDNELSPGNQSNQRACQKRVGEAMRRCN